MQPFIIASSFIFIIIAVRFTQSLKFKDLGKKSPKYQALPLALGAIGLVLTGFALLGNFEGLTLGVSALSTAFAVGAAAPASEKLLSLKELAELDQPFAAESAELFAGVRDHDFDTLAARCDDDFGIIDINPAGGSEIIRSRAEWENWFTNLFKQLTAMQADTDTLIAKYDAVNWGETGMSVVEFAQMLTVGGKTGRFNVIVTIVWKKVEGRWVEARWHSSLVSTELPEGFGA